MNPCSKSAVAGVGTEWEGIGWVGLGSRSGAGRAEVLSGLGWSCRVLGARHGPSLLATPTCGRISSRDVRDQSKLEVDSAACS